MPGTPTPNYALPTLTGTDLVKNGDDQINAALAAVDDTFTGYSEGPIGSRPTSTMGSPGIAGREYRATDTGQRFKDTGTGWIELLAAGLASRLLAAIPLSSYSIGANQTVFLCSDTSVTHHGKDVTALLLHSGWNYAGGNAASGFRIYLDGALQALQSLSPTSQRGGTIFTAQTFTGVSGAHLWKVRVEMGNVPASLASVGPGLLLLFEQA